MGNVRRTTPWCHSRTSADDKNAEMRPTRHPLRTKRSKAAAILLAGTFALAACGGDDAGSSGSNAEGDSATEAPAPPDEVAVVPASDIESNVLPDVVVNNVTLGNQVNLRNMVPSEKPVLVWMWAPH